MRTLIVGEKNAKFSVAPVAAEIEILETQLAVKRRQLGIIQSNCSHSWVITEGVHENGNYTVPEEMTGGRAFYVPQSFHPEWTRSCRLCRKSETTMKTKMVLRSGIHQPAPDFGD